MPDYQIEKMNYLLDNNASRIGIISSDPDNLAGLDGDKIAARSKSFRRSYKPMRTATQANKFHGHWVQLQV